MNVLRIPVSDLRKGMFIVDIVHSGHRIEPGVFSEPGLLVSDEDWRNIRARGYTSAYVDPARSDPPLALSAKVTDACYFDPESVPAVPTVPMPDELANASEARAQVMEAAREAASRTLLKANFSLSQARGILTPVQESVGRNANALLCLSVLHDRDDYTFSHCVDVAILSLVLGRRLGVRNNFLETLSLAGFFHDIGKLFVPQSILKFPGRLSAEQFAMVSRHAELGYDFLSSQSDVPQMVLEGALDHQERYDGSGYPYGKVGTEISFAGRLLAVVDVYDALTGKRCYRKALPPSTALSKIYSTREQDFAPGYVEALISALGVYPPGSLVQLSNRQQAVVVEANPEKRLRPKVVLLTDSRGARVRPKLCELGALAEVEIVRSLERLPFALDIERAICNAD